MTARWFLRITPWLIAAALVVPTFAKQIDRRINFDHEAKIGQTQIRPGEYELIVDGDHLTLKHGKQVVAEAPARWEKRDTKPDSDAIEYGPGNAISEIRFAGDPNALVIATP